MNRISNSLIQPTMMALGVSLFLFGYNKDLQPYNYFVHIPFWVGVLRPSGILWKNKFLKQINKDVFPEQMKNYREMYLTSKNSILYDVLFNHITYQSCISITLIVYMYTFQKILSKVYPQAGEAAKKNKNNLWQIFKQIGLPLIKGRIFFAATSILSQYWITYFSLQKKGQQFSISPQTKRFLLLKQVILNISWQGLVLKQFYRGFYNQKNLIQAQKQSI